MLMTVKTIRELAEGFFQPPVGYSPIPFWFLNGHLAPEELERQLRMMHAIGIGTVTLHARQGHTMPYLGEEWFARIRHCVEVCASLGMRVWLYDEDNWPSGYAGGETLRRYPAGQAKHLAMVPEAKAEGDVVAVVDGKAFVQGLTPWHPAYSEGWYTDLLDLRVTQAFIASTHERYAEALGKHLGTTVVAVFTDEPGFYNHFHTCAPGTVVWTGDMLEQFHARCGYGLEPHLPALFGDAEDAARVRRDFYRVVSELIVERFYLPLKAWCNERGMELVGHVNNEEYLVDHVRYNAHFFSAMDGLALPGMDVIGPAGDWHRQPDSFVPKLTSSAAHTRGKTRSMSETYGAAGWELSPEEMRRIADWLGVRGVTRIVLHAFYYSVEGPRYHECPPSLFFQSPHWPYIPALVRYLTRWSWLLENTRPVASVGVCYPIEAARALTTPRVPPSLPPGLEEAQAGEVGALGLAFRAITDGLFRARVGYDILDDAALASARVEDEALSIADQRYACLVLPPGEPSVAAKAAVERAKAAGVVVVEGAPERVVARAREWAAVEIEPASEQITVARRRAEGSDVFLVVNEGEEPYEGELLLPVAGRLTEWDWGSGRIDVCAAEEVEGGLRVALRLLGGAAACFCVGRA